jgi:hypothetical protein
MPAPNYQQAVEDASKVVARQRACATKVDGCLDRLIAQICSARDALQAGGGNSSTLTRLQREAASTVAEANSSTRELHGAVNRLSKVGGCSFHTVYA